MKIVHVSLVVLLVVGCATIKKPNLTDKPASEQTVAKTEDNPIEKKETKSTPEQISGKKWQLKWLKGVDLATVDYGTNKPYARFDVGKLTVSGNTGCNNFGGNIEIANNQLKIGMLFATKKFCMDIPEPEFLRNLEQCNKYVVEQNSLSLFKEDELLMTFQAVEEIN